MALYEFVLRRAGRDDELRITDHDGVDVGDVVVIGDREWVVEQLEPPTLPGSSERIVCIPAEPPPRRR